MPQLFYVAREQALLFGRASPLSSAPRGFTARSRVLARLASLAQIGELARRLYFTLKMYIEWHNVDILLTLQVPSNHHEYITKHPSWWFCKTNDVI